MAFFCSSTESDLSQRNLRCRFIKVPHSVSSTEGKASTLLSLTSYFSLGKKKLHQSWPGSAVMSRVVILTTGLSLPDWGWCLRNQLNLKFTKLTNYRINSAEQFKGRYFCGWSRSPPRCSVITSLVPVGSLTFPDMRETGAQTFRSNLLTSKCDWIILARTCGSMVLLERPLLIMRWHYYSIMERSIKRSMHTCNQLLGPSNIASVLQQLLINQVPLRRGRGSRDNQQRGY